MKISKIFLYDEPSVPEIQLDDLAKSLLENFSVPVEIRKNIFNSAEENTAKKISSCRIFDIKKPFVTHTPSNDEVDFEKKTFRDTLKNKNIVMYDGYKFQNVIKELIEEGELNLEQLHVVFTNKLTCTFDPGDSRYHGRAIICSNPSIISTTGIIEAPAKPREFYYEIFTKMIRGLNLEPIKQKYRGSFLENHDKRLGKVAEGYVMQSIFYHLTGEPFCEYSDCRLTNPHWQKDLIHSQIEHGKLCKKHQKILDELVIHLN